MSVAMVKPHLEMGDGPRILRVEGQEFVAQLCSILRRKKFNGGMSLAKL